VALRCLPQMQELHQAHQEFLYRMTPFRLDGLALGACVALVVRNPYLAAKARMAVRGLLPLCIAALALVIGADGSCRYTGRYVSSYGFSLLATIFASILLLVVTRGALSSILRLPALAGMGKYSYGIYVVHAPLSLYLLPRLIGFHGLGASALSILTGGAISYGLAYCSWHIFEKHFIGLKDRFV